MIICSHSNIDIIQGVIGYGNAEGITDWRISNSNAGILNILNSTSQNVNLAILENGNVGIGTTNPGSMLDIIGDANITGVYKKNNRDVINDTSNYILTASNILVPRILTEVGNGSNYVSRLTTSLNTSVDNTSNYMLSTSNILVNRIVSSLSGGGGTGSQWVNVSSGIYYNTSNVGIGTTNPTSKLHLYNDTISNTTLIVQNNMPIPTPSNITVTGTTLTQIGNGYKCISFPYTGTPATNANTTYTFTTTEAYNVDILIIGGGGAGGNSIGGGGGAGGVVYTVNQILNVGTYTVSVGRGGIGTVHPGGDGQGTVGINQDGQDSFIQSNSADVSFSMGGVNQSLRGKGGGGGGVYYSASTVPGRAGGSGGGAAERENAVYNGGNSTQGNTLWNGISYVAGGSSGNGNLTSDGNYFAAGGGGAGNTLFNTIYNGKTGVQIDITGTSQFYAAGGGGGVHASSDTTRGLGGSSIGGNGRVFSGSAFLRDPTPGASGTGSGGGGGAYADAPLLAAGSGGSGIVIIKYTRIINSSSIELIIGNTNDTNIDYKIGNYTGDFKIISSASSVDTDYIKITSSGASIYNPTGSPQWSTTSDSRIKENIEKASYDKCYDNINKLELYRFNYISEFNNINKDLRQLGYIAQEVKDIFPKAVSSTPFNNNNISIPDLLTIDISQINYSLYGTVKKLIEIDNNKESRLKKIENILIMDTTTSNVIMNTTTSNVIMDTTTISNVIMDTTTISNVIMDAASI